MNYSEYRKKEIFISETLNEYMVMFCNENPEYLSVSEIYTSKKIHLNGVQFVAGFESANNKDLCWKKYSMIPIMIELIMIWAYKNNQIIDRKNNVWSSEKNIIQNILDHDLILSCILKLLERLRKEDENQYNIISTHILEFIKALPIGFKIEQEKLSIKNTSLDKILKHWDTHYINRNIAFNSLYDLTPMIGYLISSGEDIIPKYKKSILANEKFSHVGQIINDLSDCIPQNNSFEKSYQDQYADIKNGIITYPIYKLINHELVIQALKDTKKISEKGWQNYFFQALIDEGIVSEIKIIARVSYQKHILFWESILNKENDFLNRTYRLLLENKYFKEFTPN